MKHCRLSFLLTSLCAIPFVAAAHDVREPIHVRQNAAPVPVTVRNTSELRGALRQAKPGMEILVAPGVYEGGVYVENVRGEPKRPIVLRAADPKNLPVFKNGDTGMHLPGAAYVHISDLAFEGQRAACLMVDDAGRRDGSARGIEVRRLHMREMPEPGNHDALKYAGEGMTVGMNQSD